MDEGISVDCSEPSVTSQFWVHGGFWGRGLSLGNFTSQSAREISSEGLQAAFQKRLMGNILANSATISPSADSVQRTHRSKPGSISRRREIWQAKPRAEFQSRFSFLRLVF